MKKKQLILGLVVLAALVALFFWGRQKFHFDFGVFRTQLAEADWRKIALGIICIYVAFVFRSVRWAALLKHNKKVPPFRLLGIQIIGFTAVGLIGRVADPVRPYLVSKKTGLSLGSQLAVYIVERLFDAGSMALIFSIAMLWIPEADIVKATGHSTMVTALEHRWPLLAILFAKYGVLFFTLIGALFLVAVRLWGAVVASFFEHSFGLVSKKLGAAIGDKIRTFHTGLDTMRTFSEFAVTASLSIAMWILIAYALPGHLSRLHGQPRTGFTHSPQVRVAHDRERRHQHLSVACHWLVHPDRNCRRDHHRPHRCVARSRNRLRSLNSPRNLPGYDSRRTNLGAV